MLRQARKLKPCNCWWYNCTPQTAIKPIICVNHVQDYHWINYTSQTALSAEAHQLVHEVVNNYVCYFYAVLLLLLFFGRGCLLFSFRDIGWHLIRCIAGKQPMLIKFFFSVQDKKLKVAILNSLHIKCEMFKASWLMNAIHLHSHLTSEIYYFDLVEQFIKIKQ